ncbi:hypothetical protein [Alteribacillus sp. HJP-4]|uniref:hypothetical protein n=1 Tax=Alteribacillus sp. HJP-4 TaxID=2775394 RepID=UPI0035CCE6CC
MSRCLYTAERFADDIKIIADQKKISADDFEKIAHNIEFFADKTRKIADQIQIPADQSISRIPNV